MPLHPFPHHHPLVYLVRPIHWGNTNIPFTCQHLTHAKPPSPLTPVKTGWPSNNAIATPHAYCLTCLLQMTIGEYGVKLKRALISVIFNSWKHKACRGLCNPPIHLQMIRPLFLSLRPWTFHWPMQRLFVIFPFVKKSFWNGYSSLGSHINPFV